MGRRTAFISETLAYPNRQPVLSEFAPHHLRPPSAGCPAEPVSDAPISQTTALPAAPPRRTLSGGSVEPVRELSRHHGVRFRLP